MVMLRYKREKNGSYCCFMVANVKLLVVPDYDSDG